MYVSPCSHSRWSEAQSRGTRVMDAANNGVIIMTDHMLPMRLGYEKYFMWKARNGHVVLP